MAGGRKRGGVIRCGTGEAARQALLSRDEDLVLYLKGTGETLEGLKQNFIVQIAHWLLVAG